MIENTIARNNQTVKRIALRNSQKTFANVIAEGISCSKFEASVISSKALEIFNLKNVANMWQFSVHIAGVF